MQSTPHLPPRSICSTSASYQDHVSINIWKTYLIVRPRRIDKAQVRRQADDIVRVFVEGRRVDLVMSAH